MAWTVANFIAIAVVFPILAFASLGLRFWVRRITKASFGLDDALILPAAVGVLGIGITMIVGAKLGQMAQHQVTMIGPEGPVFDNSLAIYEKCNYVLQLLPLVSLGCTKVSVLCFYRRIFVHNTFQIVNAVLIAIVAAWAVSFFFATAFQCKDPRTIWSTFEYARTDCVQTLKFYYATSITGFITDLMILISPIPAIWQLQMPLRSKIAVAGIFLLGALVCGAGIARFVTFIYIGRGIMANMHDLTYFVTPVFVWTMIESALAVVSANLPLLRPLLHKKTYTSTYVWSFLRSKLSTHSSGRLGRNTDSSVSLSQGVYVLGVGQSSEYQVHAEGMQLEPGTSTDQKIHVQREYTVV